MAQKVLLPLGMAQSTFIPDEAESALLARGYQRSAATGEVTAWPFLPFNKTYSPSTGLFASANDLGQAALTLLNRGVRNGQRILQPQSLEAMWSPVVTTNASRLLRSYGLGWVLSNVARHPLSWHPGSNPGFVSHFMLAPDDGIAVIVLVNSWNEIKESEPYYALEVGIPAMNMLLGIEE